MAALKELGDRLDGKPRQQTELSGPDDQLLGISVVLVPAKNAVDIDTLHRESWVGAIDPEQTSDSIAHGNYLPISDN